MLLIITRFVPKTISYCTSSFQECVRLSEEMRALCESLDAGGMAAKMFAANASFGRRGPALCLASYPNVGFFYGCALHGARDYNTACALSQHKLASSALR